MENIITELVNNNGEIENQKKETPFSIIILETNRIASDTTSNKIDDNNKTDREIEIQKQEINEAIRDKKVTLEKKVLLSKTSSPLTKISPFSRFIQIIQSLWTSTKYAVRKLVCKLDFCPLLLIISMWLTENNLIIYSSMLKVTFNSFIFQPPLNFVISSASRKSLTPRFVEADFFL